MIPITSIDQRLVYRSETTETKTLCKDIACITLSSTIGCSIFILWFLNEINTEFHNSTTYMDLHR